jgi:hypothetical protein
VAEVTASPHDAPLSALREHVENTAVWLAVWKARSEPDAHARRCANDAVDAIHAALAGLYELCSTLVAEIRQADDATAARVDELLARGREDRRR